MLGLPPLPRTLEAAIRDLSHERQEVRRSALADLVSLTRGAGRRRAVEALARTLLEDANAEVRSEAALGLADAEALEARDALLAALDDAHVRVRQMTVLALGELDLAGDQEVLGVLEPLLGAEQPSLRFQALIAFERLAGTHAEQALVRASMDGDDEIRAMAFRLSERRWPPGSQPPGSLLERARAALESVRTAARATAALFLAAHGERSADDALVDVIDGRMPAATLADVQAAIELAADLELFAACPALARRAFGAFGTRRDSLAWHASIALARLGDERAKRAIVHGLSAWTRDGRTLAVVAAGRARLPVVRDTLLRFRGDPARADPEAVEEALALLGETDGSLTT